MRAVTDLCDDHPDDVRVVEPIFRDFGGVRAFGGGIATLKVFEDNSLVRESLGQPGRGRVLVVDGGGSLRCALLGGNLATLAEKNGWAGVIVYGAVRDLKELAAARVGVRALALHPRKSDKRGAGERELAITFGGVTFKPGEHVYADEDGIVVSSQSIA